MKAREWVQGARDRALGRRSRRWAAALTALVAIGCGQQPNRVGSPSGDGTPVDPSSTPAQVGNQQATIRVEIQGLDALTFADGSKFSVERFVVNLGGLSLFRDLADPSAARVEMPGRQLPIFGP